MRIHETIASARRKKGLTQEELADLTSVTVRTIQRIESGESLPRKFTLKAIGAALDIPFEELNSSHTAQNKSLLPVAATGSQDDTRHFLELICLSCFSYIVIPFVHFLIPSYILNKRNETDLKVIGDARKLIRTQIYWAIATPMLLLLTLAFNFLQAVYLDNKFVIHYLWPFFFMYTLNAIIITASLIFIRRSASRPAQSA
ncbi:MAG TPA: helix-turn-helix transcriptional regulator [Chitinophagaceae bacterium]